MRAILLILSIFASSVFASNIASAQTPTANKKAEVEKRVKAIKKLDNRIKNIDADIIKLQKEITQNNATIESLEIQEAKAKEKLEEDLERISKMALNMARAERLPLDVLTFAEGDLRKSHKRIGVISQGRNTLANNITQQRKKVYELQEIRTAKSEYTTGVKSKQAKIASHRKKLQELFDKQIKSLRLADKKQAKVLANARKAAKKATNLEQLAAMARQVSLTEAPVEHRTYKYLPVRGHVVKEYGTKNKVGVKAQGVTVETTTSEPVKSLEDGRVIYSDTFRDYGHIIIVEHKDGINTLYSGLKKSAFKVGDFARAGQVIGLMPKESAPELYLEIRKGGQTVDPINWIKRRKI